MKKDKPKRKPIVRWVLTSKRYGFMIGELNPCANCFRTKRDALEFLELCGWGKGDYKPVKLVEASDDLSMRAVRARG